MANPSTTACDECGSPFVPGVSSMDSLCAECAHVLYGKAMCTHPMHETSSEKRDCTRCGWNGSRSEHIKKFLADRGTT